MSFKPNNLSYSLKCFRRVAPGYTWFRLRFSLLKRRLFFSDIHLFLNTQITEMVSFVVFFKGAFNRKYLNSSIPKKLKLFIRKKISLFHSHSLLLKKYWYFVFYLFKFRLKFSNKFLLGAPLSFLFLYKLFYIFMGQKIYHSMLLFNKQHRFFFFIFFHLK